MRLITLLLLAFALVCGASAQTEAQRAEHSEKILNKIKALDLMNHMLPLLMTVDQMKQMLPVLEKCREKEKQQQIKEYELLRKYETRLDEANKKALQTSQVPGRDLLNELATLFKSFNLGREVIVTENTDAVVAAMKKILNEGQIKAAIGDLNPALFDPSLKPDKMTDEEKLRFYVRTILLDAVAYDVLLRMSQKK
jgi:hypothetical protein